MVVLSNNDCFIVARSAEAKALGIADLQATFEARDLLRRHKVHIFSSNYPLYGDISRRVMDTLRDFAPAIEVYSIDEMFLDLTGVPLDLKAHARRIRETVWQHVRMPVSVGIAPTKTLAKLANRAAKMIPACAGVCVLDNPHKWEWVRQRMPVTKVWGVGNRLARRLERLGITTADQLARADSKLIRRHFSVMLERTVTELNGTPCIALEHQPQPKQQIYSTRSFGAKLTELIPIQQAITLYACRAAEKLRQQQSLASTLHVFLQTSLNEPPYYNNSILLQLPYPTDDNRLLTHYAKQAITLLYRPGYRFLKAGVGLLELSNRQNRQQDLFHPGQNLKADRLMQVVDRINQRHGRGTLFLGAEGFDKKWKMRQSYKSPRYTTCWQDLPIIRS